MVLDLIVVNLYESPRRWPTRRSFLSWRSPDFTSQLFHSLSPLLLMSRELHPQAISLSTASSFHIAKRIYIHNVYAAHTTACGLPSAADTTPQPSKLFYESQAASDPKPEAMAITTMDPSTTAYMSQHDMLRADTAATTMSTTVSSDAPVCAGPSNSSPHQQKQEPAQLRLLMGALSLGSPDQPATPSSARESGYEADGERKLERPEASRRQLSRRTLRKRQRRRLLGETVVRRSRSGTPSLRARTTQEARQRRGRQAWRRSF